jgi:hypothetical protein
LGQVFSCTLWALTIYLVWKAIEELNGSLFALVLGATCVLFSALLRLNTLYQPNSFDVLSWTALYFILLKYYKTQNTKWLFVGAVVFAVGFLNKYNIVFQLIGLIPALLITEQRKIFLRPKFYFASIIALLIILPNLIWQYNNGLPVFHHLDVLAKTQLVNVNRIDFLKSQILFFIGSILVIAFSLYALLLYKPFKPYRFFFWSLVFTLSTFMYFKGERLLCYWYLSNLYSIWLCLSW